MDLPLTPLILFLRIAGRRFPIEEFSESGLTVAPDILTTQPFQEARRGGQAVAALDLCADGAVDTYPVRLRLAAVTPAGVEVAFADIPAQARIRLRHASRAVPAGVTATLEMATLAPGAGGALGPQEQTRLASGRRLVLPGSAAVWEVTEARRQRWHLPAPRPVAASGAPVPREVTSMARIIVMRGIAALAMGTTVLLALALGIVLRG